MTPSQDEVSQLLVAWSNGEQAALDRLMPWVCDELRRIAKHHMNRQPPGHTLDALQMVSWDETAVISEERTAEVVALDEALRGFADIDPRKSPVVGIRYFGGLSVEETAEVLKVSPDTVMRDWRLARIWLRRELGRG